MLGGGPWGTAGARDLPTLKQELSLIYACLMQSKPVVGIELGAQLLALAADGGSEPAPLAFEIGHGTRTDADALNGFLPERFPFVSYMRDRALPPAYARVLAADPAGAPALFQIGENAFGFGFHPGFKLAIGEDLIMEFDDNPPDPAAAARTAAAHEAGNRGCAGADHDRSDPENRPHGRLKQYF